MKDYYPGNLGGNDRRYVRPVRPYDHNQNDRRGGTYRKNGFQRRKPTPEVNVEVLNEGLQVIKDCLLKNGEVQNRMAEVQERIAKAQERKADAMEQIAVYLKHIVGSDAAESIAEFSDQLETAFDGKTSTDVFEAATVSETSSAVLEAPVAQETPPSQAEAPDAIAVIIDMRQTGASYDSIAEYLNTEEIESLSGNGKWNRKTVSKVYNEAVS
jgi:hypothetical protein